MPTLNLFYVHLSLANNNGHKTHINTWNCIINCLDAAHRELDIWCQEKWKCDAFMVLLCDTWWHQHDGLISGLKSQSYTKQDYIWSWTVIKHAAESFSTNRFIFCISVFVTHSWRLHSRSFQQIMCLCHINLNSKALAALQPAVTRVIAFHQISWAFPAVFHQQQGSFSPQPSISALNESLQSSIMSSWLCTHTHKHINTHSHALAYTWAHAECQTGRPSCCMLIAG